MSQEREKLSPEKSFWGWKLLAISIVLSCIFMGIFYLAITNEPDYMPSQQNKATQQHDMSKMDHASMSQEDMAKMDQGKMDMEHSTSEPMATHHP